jgi:tRNA threonylcarbamoyl adenosine modification protein (Sua5/YciO/YrdC/YwlC family)
MRTEFLTLDGGSGDGAKIAHAAQLLRAGQLVAFPTETVYGLGADAANPDALARLARVTGRNEGKPFSLLVPGLKHAEQAVQGFPRIAQKLARIYWPGPLTLVFPARTGRPESGLRLPEDPVARALLGACGFTLAVPSANRAGSPEPLRADTVRDALDGQIALILDRGPTLYGKPSTVVRVDGESIQIQREGILSAREILELARPTILFVCTGNTCRSPMAAGFCRAGMADAHRTASFGLLRSAGESLPFRVLSAGTSALDGGRADANAIEAMREVGIDISTHRTLSLTPGLVDAADWIFVMTRAHRASIVEFMPGATPRVQLLSREGDDIGDPASQPLNQYRRSRDRIAVCLRDVVRMVKGSEV